jgi:glycosyltransferase involved in cell wall biosynthesis
MILELIQGSRHEWVIFTNHYYPEQTFPAFQELPIVELSKVPVGRGYSAVSSAAITILRQKIDLSKFDALFVSSEGLGDFITFRNHNIPVICYCHTPLKVIHDPFVRHRYLAENRLMSVPFFVFSWMFKFFDRLAWRYYQYVFCNSNEVKQRILKARLAPEEKVEVLPPGLDTTRITPSWEYQKYFVVVGRIKWWKNLELAIEAFHEFKSRYPQFADFKLLITGLVEKGSEEYLKKLMSMAGDRNDVEFKRDPSEEELMDAYRLSYCLIFPSLNEDWGITPLEAMGFGKPVIAVNRGGPTESIVDGKTGFLVPAKAGAFADKMALLAGDLALTRRLGKAGSEHVKQYDWSHFVKRLDEYFSTLKG